MECTFQIFGGAGYFPVNCVSAILFQAIAFGEAEPLSVKLEQEESDKVQTRIEGGLFVIFECVTYCSFI